MTSVKIIDNGLLTHLKKVQNNSRIVREILVRTGVDGENELRKRIADDRKIATKAHDQSIRHEVRGNTVEIGSDLPSSKYALEFGRGPGKPPPASALKQWSRIRLGSEKAVFAVAKKIGLTGTKAPRIFSSLQPKMNKLFENHLRRLNDFYLK